MFLKNASITLSMKNDFVSTFFNSLKETVHCFNAYSLLFFYRNENLKVGSLETVNCPVCGSPHFHEIIQAPDRFSVEQGVKFSIVGCDVCGFRFLNPRPEAAEMSAYYTNADYQPFISAQAKQKMWDRLYRLVRVFALTRKRKTIEKLKQPGRLLDVGCGTGEFLFEMQQHGWEVEGIEPDEAAVKYAREHLGLQVKVGGEKELAGVEKQYDVLTLWHVLEHVSSPQKLLAHCENLLAEGGLLLVAVPNIASLDAAFYGPLWVALDAPRHLSHFTPGVMQRLLDGTRLRLVKLNSMPLDGYYNCLMSEFLRFKVQHVAAVLKPVYLLRAVVVASASVMTSANFRKQSSRNGSSILYFIQKES